MPASLFEHGFASPTTLMLPDFDDDSADYWQQHWIDGRLDCRPVHLGHIKRPDRNTLVAWLDRAIRDAEAPVVLVGHGMGALTIAAWAGLMSSESETTVAGALLIAPGDPMAAGADPRLAAFAPLPSSVFSFPALVVASDDDPALSPERAFSFARQWGAGYALMQGCGHFRAADGLGRWREGEELLDRFIDLVEPECVSSIRSMPDTSTLFQHPRPSGTPLFRP